MKPGADLPVLRLTSELAIGPVYASLAPWLNSAPATATAEHLGPEEPLE
jgi:hypothetical protein